MQFQMWFLSLHTVIVFGIKNYYSASVSCCSDDLAELLLFQTLSYRRILQNSLSLVGLFHLCVYLPWLFNLYLPSRLYLNQHPCHFQVVFLSTGLHWAGCKLRNFYWKAFVLCVTFSCYTTVHEIKFNIQFLYILVESMWAPNPLSKLASSVCLPSLIVEQNLFPESAPTLTRSFTFAFIKLFIFHIPFAQRTA